MKETLYGDPSVIGMRGCEKFAEQVDGYRRSGDATAERTRTGARRL